MILGSAVSLALPSEQDTSILLPLDTIPPISNPDLPFTRLLHPPHIDPRPLRTAHDESRFPAASETFLEDGGAWRNVLVWRIVREADVKQAKVDIFECCP